MRANKWIWGALAVALVPLAAGFAAESGMWHTDVEAAKRLAAESDRLVVLHFWAPWCGPCMRLDREVLNQPGVAQALDSHYVLVKLNYDDCPALAQRYGVQVLPTDVVITPYGQMVNRLQSAPTLARYTGQLAQVAVEAKAQKPAAYIASVPAAGGADADSASEERPSSRYTNYRPAP